jgi:protein-tyrosine phosphatase
MDAANLADVRRQAGAAADRERVLMFRAFDPDVDDSGPIPDVPDPWGGPVSGFEEVLAIVERTADVIVGRVEQLLAVR